MDKNFDIIDPIQIPDWDKMALSTSNYSIFHSAAWARVLSDSYGFRPLYFTSMNKGDISISVPFMEINSSITGRRGISLPFSDYCDPIFNQTPDEKEVLNFLIKYGKRAGWKYFEIRESNNFLTEPEALKFYHHVLRLPNNENEVLARFRDSTRRNIKKAIKQDIQITIGNSIDHTREYYRLHCITRKYHGIPPQPYKFFHTIFQFILSNNLGIIVLAKYRNKYIAGNVYFHFGKKAYYKFGASDRDYQQYRAPNLVMWEAIKYYIRNSFESLCFGKTDMNDKGLMQYKDGWGPECSIIKYHKYDLLNDNFINEEIAIPQNTAKIMKRLPIPLLKIIGTLFYKHMG